MKEFLGRSRPRRGRAGPALVPCCVRATRACDTVTCRCSLGVRSGLSLQDVCRLFALAPRVCLGLVGHWADGLRFSASGHSSPADVGTWLVCVVLRKGAPNRTRGLPAGRRQPAANFGLSSRLPNGPPYARIGRAGWCCPPRQGRAATPPMAAADTVTPPREACGVRRLAGAGEISAARPRTPVLPDNRAVTAIRK